MSWFQTLGRGLCPGLQGALPERGPPLPGGPSLVDSTLLPAGQGPGAGRSYGSSTNLCVFHQDRVTDHKSEDAGVGCL